MPRNINMKIFVNFVGYQLIKYPKKYHIRKNHIITIKINTAETILSDMQLKYSSKVDNEILAHWDQIMNIWKKSS